jgi:hypothetical protein
MKRLLTLTAVLEAGTGLALVAIPSLVATLLLGSSLDAPIALIVARVAGVAVLSLAVACWIARDDGQSRATRGLVGALLLYNAGVTALLVHAGTARGLSGIGLWPVVLYHAVMTAWCVVGLRNRPAQV